MGIDRGFELGAQGDEERDFNRADWVFLVFKIINKVNLHVDCADAKPA